MKKYLALAAAALFAAAAASNAAEPLPVFNATLTVGKEHRFVLVNAAGKSSGFLALGESFDGCTLKAYDAKSATLDLERDGQVSRVALVADAATVNAPASTPATLADAEEVFRVMRFDEMMKKVLEGQKKAMGPMLQQSIGQGLARMNTTMSDEDKAALAELQGKVMDETFSVITGPEMRTAMAQIYSDVFSKEELNSMAGFYGTPGGQALIDKQPEVQQKMMAVMMPMIMKTQQGAQRQLAEFMIGLKTKYAAPAKGTPASAPAAPAPKP